MKSNIYNQKDYQSILKRIDAMRPENKRKWGKMNIEQMLEHCSLQLKLGLGHIKLSGFEGPSIQRTWLVRKLMLFVIPWTKGLPTPSQMNVVKNTLPSEEFDAEKDQLIRLLEEVQQNPNLKPHAFFGAMNQTDWGRLIWKHLDYHLKQFNG